jgi:hypothetical protein
LAFQEIVQRRTILHGAEGAAIRDGGQPGPAFSCNIPLD